MLTELHVTDLGVIEDISVTLGPGMTALTGETGAGKTLLVDAIALLLGHRADAAPVRPGAAETTVEGRFASAAPAEEVVLCRVVPAVGRARGYVDGRMAGAPQLAARGAALVDLHGQHAHQSLLRPATQRAALDRYAGISTDEVETARRRVRELRAAQSTLGGDSRSRARELDLLRYQLAELDGADLGSPSEDDDLQGEEALLADAGAVRAAAAAAAEEVAGEDGLVDRLGAVVGELGSAPLRALHDRLAGVQAELADVASEARALAERLEDDPARLAEIGARRHVLTDLRRKYGDTLAEVIEFRDSTRARIEELEDHDRLAATLDGEIAVAAEALAAAEQRLGDARRDAAPAMGEEIAARLQELAMPRARFEVSVGPAPGSGDDVTWMLGANPGEPALPLVKVASGGELARAMLAARLILTARGGEAGVDDPPTLVFDEVDAGIGGEAAVAVGRALAALAGDHQVLVVTHLPQVAAFADRHLVVSKDEVGARTVATVRDVDGPARVVELSRMLSGRPDSATARRHAEELLAQRQG